MAISAQAYARRVIRNRGGNFAEARAVVNARMAVAGVTMERYYLAVLAAVNEEANAFRMVKGLAPRGVYTCEPGRWIARDGVPLFYIGIDGSRTNWDTFGPVEADNMAKQIADLLNAAE